MKVANLSQLAFLQLASPDVNGLVPNHLSFPGGVSYLRHLATVSPTDAMQSDLDHGPY